MTKRHLQAEKDGRIRTEIGSSVALGGMILINDSPRSARLIFFLSCLLNLSLQSSEIHQGDVGLL